MPNPASRDPAAGRTSAAPPARAIVSRVASASGGDLLVRGRWRPVIDLRRATARGLALSQEIERLDGLGDRRKAPPTSLGPVDLERADLIGAERAMRVLEPAEPSDKPPLLFLPVSWSTVSGPGSRRRLLRLAATAQARLRMAAVCELTGLQEGMPPSIVRAVTGALQPIFRGVLAHVKPTRRAIAAVRDCGFSGPAVDARDLSDAADEEAVLRIGLALQAVGPGVLFHGVRSIAALNAAREAGVSWASLDLGAAAWPGFDAKTAAGEAPTAVNV